MRIVFMGTPDFAAVSLQRLLDAHFDVVGVFTQPDKPKNRGMKLQPSPVKEIALANGLPVFQPEKMRDGTALAALQSLQPDILVVVAYGRTSCLPPRPTARSMCTARCCRSIAGLRPSSGRCSTVMR